MVTTKRTRPAAEPPAVGRQMKWLIISIGKIVNNRKFLFLSIAISLGIISIIIYYRSINRLFAETITIQSYSRPWITATPISSNKDMQNLTEIIKPYYLLNNCSFTSIEQSPAKMPKLELIEDNTSFDSDKYIVIQIADSLDKSYRAFLVDEEISCPGQTYTCFRSRIYICELTLRKVYKLNWVEFAVSRPIVMMIWVGNNTLTFLQSMGPHGGILFGIGMKEQGFVYYSQFGACS
jgi:hypothetical protein